MASKLQKCLLIIYNYIFIYKIYKILIIYINFILL